MDSIWETFPLRPILPLKEEDAVSRHLSRTKSIELSMTTALKSLWYLDLKISGLQFLHLPFITATQYPKHCQARPEWELRFMFALWTTLISSAFGRRDVRRLTWPAGQPSDLERICDNVIALKINTSEEVEPPMHPHLKPPYPT